MINQLLTTLGLVRFEDARRIVLDQFLSEVAAVKRDLALDPAKSEFLQKLRADGHHFAADLIVMMLHDVLDKHADQADDFATTCSLLGIEPHQSQSDHPIRDEIASIRDLLEAKPHERLRTLVARYKAKAESSTLFGVVCGGDS